MCICCVPEKQVYTLGHLMNWSQWCEHTLFLCTCIKTIFHGLCTVLSLNPWLCHLLSPQRNPAPSVQTISASVKSAARASIRYTGSDNNSPLYSLLSAHGQIRIWFNTQLKAVIEKLLQISLLFSLISLRFKSSPGLLKHESRTHEFWLKKSKPPPSLYQFLSLFFFFVTAFDRNLINLWAPASSIYHPFSTRPGHYARAANYVGAS